MSAVPVRDDATVEVAIETESALSAFIDGELADLPAGDRAALRRDWDAYHLIGDVMRSEELGMAVSPRFSRNLAAALAAEPAMIAAPARPVRRALARYGVPGAALAAAVVAITWVAQPYIAPTGTLQARQPAVVSNSMMASSVPVDPQLEDYFDAHRHLAGMGGITQVSFEPGRP